MKQTALTSFSATIVAVVALVGITALGILGKIDSGALIAIYSAVLGGAFGHVNGTAVARADYDHRMAAVEKQQKES